MTGIVKPANQNTSFFNLKLFLINALIPWSPQKYIANHVTGWTKVASRINVNNSKIDNTISDLFLRLTIDTQI